jgi:hypothetical protein
MSWARAALRAVDSNVLIDGRPRRRGTAAALSGLENGVLPHSGGAASLCPRLHA